MIDIELETRYAQVQSSKQAADHDLDTMRQKADMLNQRLITATANLEERVSK